MWKAALIAGLLVLAGCGFQPVYEQKDGTSAQLFLSNISMTPVSGRLGQLFRIQLEDRLPTPVANPALLLNISINKHSQPVGITLERRITRYNVMVEGTITLADAKTGKPLLTEPLEAIASYNVIQDSDFATHIAERDATERAVLDLVSMVEQRLVAFYQRSYAKQGTL